MAVKGTWADGSPLLAIPNYARLNRLTARIEGNRTPVSMSGSGNKTISRSNTGAPAYP